LGGGLQHEQPLQLLQQMELEQVLYRVDGRESGAHSASMVAGQVQKQLAQGDAGMSLIGAEVILFEWGM